jgi:hypothetical protein
LIFCRSRRGTLRHFFDHLIGTEVAHFGASGEVAMMSLVRLLGFTTLACGCVTGRYREVATHREVIYVEEKGHGCAHSAHRRNHTLAPARFGAPAPLPISKAS